MDSPNDTNSNNNSASDGFDEQINVNEISEFQKQNQYQLDAKKTVRVKLIITEIPVSSSDKTLRKLLSPILTKFDMNQKFGFFHTAIVIGPWFVNFFWIFYFETNLLF